MGETVKKPPLGIKPRAIWEKERIDEILKAMKRYSDADVRIPAEWVDELYKLMEIEE